MPSLLDQTALADVAERIVAAAKRAGADQADAFAVRGVSLSVEVRDGAVEESQRSEGDDLGLRVLVGRKQAVVSTNDLKSDGFAALAERAVAMARAAPEDSFAGLADPALLAHEPARARFARSRHARRRRAGTARARGGGGGHGGLGRQQIGRRLGLGRHRRPGAGDEPRLPWRGHELASLHLDVGHRRQRHRHGDRLRLHLDAARRRPGKRHDIGRNAGERAVKRLNPRKVTTRRVPVVFDTRVAGSLIGHLANAVNGASIARKTSFLREKLGEQIFAPGIDIIDDPLRKRGQRSRPFDAEGVVTSARKVVEGGVLKTWFLDSATGRELGLATTGHAYRSVSSPPSPGPSNLHLAAGRKSADALIAEIADGFYVTDLIGVGVNLVTGDYSRGASGFWIENGALTFPVSEVTIAGHLTEIFKSLTPANDLVFRYGTNAPTVRVEGLTVAGH